MEEVIERFLEEVLSQGISFRLRTGEIKISRNSYEGKVEISFVGDNNKEYAVYRGDHDLRKFLRQKLTEYFAKKLGGRVLEGREFLGGLVLGNKENEYVVYLFNRMIVDKIVGWDGNSPILERGIVIHEGGNTYIMVKYRNEWGRISEYLSNISKIINNNMGDIVNYLKNELVNYAVSRLEEEITESIDWLNKKLGTLGNEANMDMNRIEKLKRLKSLLNTKE